MSKALERLKEESVQILWKYGSKKQKIKAVEELLECTLELARDFQVSGVREEVELGPVREEIADALIMLYQMRTLFGVVAVDQYIIDKLDRMKERS